MNAASTCAMLVIAALGLTSKAAMADCTPGETHCGADSLVEHCTVDHTWRTDPSTGCNRSIPQPRPDESRFDDRSRITATNGNCTSGISRCGAGGQVERCTDSNTWAVDPGSFCSR